MGVKNTSAKRGQVVNHNYTRKSYNDNGYNSFEEFYPFYLGEHCQSTNRRLHLIGTSNGLILMLFAILTTSPLVALAAVLQAYFLAWIGHFLFEQNKPATFQHPIYSLMGDMRMWWEVVNGSRPF